LSVFDKDDLAILRGIYNQAGLSNPLVTAYASEGTLFDQNQFLIYGNFTTQLDAKHIFNKYFDTRLNIEELF